MRGSRWLLRGLGLYVLMQFSWWAYLLVSVGGPRSGWMVLGEGVVFAGLLLWGLMRLDRAMRLDRERLGRERSFLLAVTHDLKTPLSAVQLGVDTLRRLELGERDRGVVLAEMQSGVHDLERRIEDILTATRLQQTATFVPEAFDWESCVSKALARLDERGSARVDVRGPSTPSDDASESLNGGLVLGDEALWVLSMVNLLENALKYSTGRVGLVWDQTDRHVTFRVADNGPGIAPEAWKRALRPFVRLTEDGAGTGLGLHLVSETAQRHGAQLTHGHQGDGLFFVEVAWPQRGG